MNERIRELADEAAKFSAIMALPTGESGDKLFVEKFAELIEEHVGRAVVAKCAEICDMAATASEKAYEDLRYKDISAALVARGAQAQAEKLSVAIKQHFELDNKLDL